MDDTIYRQDAIDAIMSEPADAHYPSWYAERLEQLPSAHRPVDGAVDSNTHNTLEALEALDERKHGELINDLLRMSEMNSMSLWKRDVCKRAADALSVPAVEVPQTGIGDLSDGYHTFNGLYRQRLILFATLVKTYKDRAWKSYRHEDGELCFGGGWFIVGIDTPEGSYTYHYENKDFDLFDCEELPVGKHWDGHTEDDVTRLLSLAVDAVEVVGCNDCKHNLRPDKPNPVCGLDMPVFDIYGYCSFGERREDGDT